MLEMPHERNAPLGMRVAMHQSAFALPDGWIAHPRIEARKSAA